MAPWAVAIWETAAGNLRRQRLDARLTRVIAIASWFALTVLSLLPGGLRPHALASGDLEHLFAYALSGFVTRLAFRQTTSRLQILAFAVAAAVFELLQLVIPGRTSAVSNWIASATGACIGVALARMVAHRTIIRKHAGPRMPHV